MANCSQKVSGNIFDNNSLQSGPYTGSVEKRCTGPDGSFSDKYVSFSSTQRPQNPEELQRTLRSAVEDNKNNTGVWGLLKNVFGSSSAQTMHAAVKDQPQYEPATQNTESTQLPQISIAREQWPEPKDTDSDEDFKRGPPSDLFGGKRHSHRDYRDHRDNSHRTGKSSSRSVQKKRSLPKKKSIPKRKPSQSTRAWSRSLPRKRQSTVTRTTRRK